MDSAIESSSVGVVEKCAVQGDTEKGQRKISDNEKDSANHKSTNININGGNDQPNDAGKEPGEKDGAGEQGCLIENNEGGVCLEKRKTHIGDLPEDVFGLIFGFSEAGDSLTAASRHFYPMRRLLLLRLNRTYSRKYRDDENFRNLVHSRLENPSKQLSLTLTTLSNYTGKGVYTYRDGGKYDGDFVDGKMHGNGVFTWPDGEKYDGDYVDDKMHGKGVFTLPDGRKYRSEWQNDSRTGDQNWI